MLEKKTIRGFLTFESLVQRHLICLLAFLVLVGSFSGCTRRFFRRSADKETNALIKEKDVDPRWKLENFYIYPDPRARFSNPTNPDHQPMPPDDPGAAQLAPTPQKPGKAGIAFVEGNGYMDLLAAWDVENRLRRQLKGEDDSEIALTTAYQDPSKGKDGKITTADAKEVGTLQKPFLITLEQAMQLGIINSREFQSRREDVYLNALPVTLERFSFASQFFFTEDAIREWRGSKYPTGPANRWTFDSNGGFTKLFPTGALLALRFANETVINLTGKFPQHTVSVSDLNLDLVQPLLRGGGKAVTLEPLTQAERNLVYEIRSYARFRKQFYVFIAGGRDVLPSGTGVGGGGRAISPGIIEGVTSPQITPGTAGRLILATGQIATAEGFLPTLQKQALVENEQKNIDALSKNLRFFRAFKLAERVSKIQVDQVETQLLQSINTKKQRVVDYADSLDRLKIQLGMPVTVPLELDDSPIRPIKAQLKKYEKNFSDFVELEVKTKGLAKNASDLGEKTTDLAEKAETLEKDIKDFSGGAEEKKKLQDQLTKLVQLQKESREVWLKEMNKLAGSLQKSLEKVFESHPAVKGTDFPKTFKAQWEEWKKLTDKELKDRLDVKRKGSPAQIAKELEDKLTNQLFKGIQESSGSKEEKQLQELKRKLDWGYFEDALRNIQKEPWKKETKEKLIKAEFDTAFITVHAWFMNIMVQHVLDERLEDLRMNWPEVPPLIVDGVDLLKAPLNEAQEVVVRAAINNRLDLMNAKAQLMDSWRQINVFANSLLGVFNVRYHLDSTTPPGEAKPLAFSGKRSRNQLILNTELPLVRKAERNNYRSSIIGYERARRAYMAAEDFVADTVREEIRQLRVLAEQYKTQQQAVHLAYPQVDGAERDFYAPPSPDQSRQPSSSSNAALTNQLLQAQSRLVNAQNQIYTLWVDYLITRLQLYRDLEMMTLNQRGEWIDEFTTRETGDGAGPNQYGDQWRHPQDSDGLPSLQPVPERLPAPQPVPPAKLGQEQQK